MKIEMKKNTLALRICQNQNFYTEGVDDWYFIFQS